MLSGMEVDVVIADRNGKLKMESGKFGKATLQLGENYLNNLNKFDLIIKSPGIPPSEIKDIDKNKITNSTQIFLDSISDSGAKVIGVTGSKGKSTTASLIYEILKAADIDTYLVGNIGEPAIKYLYKAKPDTIFVMEMSSHQLNDLSVSPHIAVITSFFPEHLDYYGSVEAYKDAKKNISRFQTTDDAVFYNGESDCAKEIADDSKGTKIGVNKDDSPLPITGTKLIGEHNLINIALAYKVSEQLGVDSKTAIKTIKEFQGLPHRLQNLGEHHGIIWIDDSISTTPESAIAAIDAVGDVSTIILGGQDRGNDFTDLGKRIADSSIENVILIGESSPRIREAIEGYEAKVEFYEAQDMKSAVKESTRVTSNEQRATNNICLLSPASPSYDMFENFEVRGNEFRQNI